LTREGLAEALVQSEIVEPAKAAMRAVQLWRWIHHAGVTDFGAMTNVSKALRQALADHFTLARPEVVSCPRTGRASG
jgi:23S rRNA (adenine2503-C2)-methyltransferase